MKVCTKCKRELADTQFNRHSQKPSGLNPSCKECERKHREERLKRIKECCRCKSSPHMNGDAYCYKCSREVKRRPEPRWKKRNSDLELCPKCGYWMRDLPNAYCKPCKQEWQNKHRRKMWRQKLLARQIDPEERRRYNANAYAVNLLYRGKIKRGPCVFCGNPGTQFHHYDYEDRTRNFEDVCYGCHLRVHRFLGIMLTVHRMQM